MKTLLFFIAAASLAAGCGPQTQRDNGQRAESPPLLREVEERIPAGFSYNIAQPDSIYELEKALDEISGLQWWGENSLLAIADEKGIIYVLDAGSGAVLDSAVFGKDGDFEGICRAGSDLYVLKSNGEVFVVPEFSGEGFGEVRKIETGLAYNCEGIFFNKATGKFLITCKDTIENVGRAVFATSLRAGEKPEIAHTISVEDLEDSLITTTFDKVAYAVANALSSRDHAGILGPSGLSINPKDQKIYLLSGTSSLLVILSPEGIFETAVPLPIDILPQPEGIAFSPAGDLYIASERANKQHGVIVKFIYNE